jgi:hypothetical protein
MNLRVGNFLCFELSDPVLWIRIGFNADPDPAFYLDADPDPDAGSQIDADPDPDPGQTSLKVDFT